MLLQTLGRGGSKSDAPVGRGDATTTHVATRPREQTSHRHIAAAFHIAAAQVQGGWRGDVAVDGQCTPGNVGGTGQIAAATDGHISAADLYRACSTHIRTS